MFFQAVVRSRAAGGGPREAWRDRPRSRRAPPPSHLQLRPAPRGQAGGGPEFPLAGARVALQAGGLFLFTERKGKWKRRGGGGWSPLRRPSAGPEAVSQGPTRAARVRGRRGAHSTAWARTARQRSGAGSPGSRSCRRRTWGPRRARLPGAARQLRREPSGDGGGAARRPQVRVRGLGAVVRSQPCWVPRRFAP